MSEAFSIPERTTELLQARHPLHDQALELYEAGEFEAADEAFQEAATLSKTRADHLREIVSEADDRLVQIVREVAYGRVLIHWALSTEAQYRYDRDETVRRTMFSLALARASRGFVLLAQDQHNLVSADELDAAKDTIQILREKVDTFAVPVETVPMPVSAGTLDANEAEIFEMVNPERMLAA